MLGAPSPYIYWARSKINRRDPCSSTDIDVPPRQHPWTTAKRSLKQGIGVSKITCKFLVLEDFKPWSHYAAIPRLRISGVAKWKRSIFETNDCGLRPRDETKRRRSSLGTCSCPPDLFAWSFDFIFRDLAWNVSAPTIDGLKRRFTTVCDNVPNIPAVVWVGNGHYFTSIDKAGRAVRFVFWAWGRRSSAMGHCI